MNTKIYHIGGPTIVLEVENTFKICIDPSLGKEGTVYNFKSFDSCKTENPFITKNLLENVDLWLITHNHEDHFDYIGLDYVKKIGEVVSDKVSSAFLDNLGVNNKFLKWGQSVEYSLEALKIKVTAVPAYHTSSKILSFVMNKINGYIIEVYKDNLIKTFYFTGDTIYNNNLKKFLCDWEIDFLIPNLGAVLEEKTIGPLTMNGKMLNQMISDLSPSITVPVHYDGFSHYKYQEDYFIHDSIKKLSKGVWYDI